MAGSSTTTPMSKSLPQATEFNMSMLWDYLIQALHSMRANPLRSGLTATGVMVGVFSVVLIIALGRAMEREVAGSIDALGANMIFVFPTSGSGTSTSPGLTERDLATIRRTIPQALRTTAIVSGAARVQAAGISADTTLRGVSAEYQDIARLSPLEGRLFSQAEERVRANVAILGRSTAEAISSENSVVGRRIRINGISTEIIGIVASSTSSTSGDPNDFIITPLTTARQRFGLGGGAESTQVNTILVELDPSDDLDVTQSNILSALNRSNRVSEDVPPPYSASNTKELSESTSELVRGVQLFLAAIASVSIVVGGIGITNIMLVTVHERTREIGLRMAVGATREAIRDQFLIEAAVLCLAGGLSGICLAALSALLISIATGFSVSIRPDHLIWAFCLSVLIGLGAGYLPARKAARLNPIDALKRE